MPGKNILANIIVFFLKNPQCFLNEELKRFSVNERKSDITGCNRISLSIMLSNKKPITQWQRFKCLDGTKLYQFHK